MGFQVRFVGVLLTAESSLKHVRLNNALANLTRVFSVEACCSWSLTWRVDLPCCKFREDIDRYNVLIMSVLSITEQPRRRSL